VKSIWQLAKWMLGTSEESSNGFEKQVWNYPNPHICQNSKVNYDWHIQTDY